MARQSPKPCAHPACPALVFDGSGWCAKHVPSEGKFADQRRGTRHERGYGSDWDKLRIQILARDMYLCQVCLPQGLVRPARTVDHVTPKAEGGTDDPDNLQAICDDCHRAKTQREAWRGRGRRRPG